MLADHRKGQKGCSGFAHRAPGFSEALLVRLCRKEIELAIEMFVTSKRILMLEEREAWRDTGIAQRMFKEIDPCVSVTIKHNPKELVSQFRRDQSFKNPRLRFGGVLIPVAPCDIAQVDLIELLFRIDAAVPVGVMMSVFNESCWVYGPVLHQPFRSEEIREFLSLCPRLRE